MTDAQGVIQFVNRAFERKTGLQPGGGCWPEHAHPQELKSGEQDESFYRNLWDILIGGKVWEGRIVNKRKDGALYFEETTITQFATFLGPDGQLRGRRTGHLRLSAPLQRSRRWKRSGAWQAA